jgi:antitoxin component of MazEF toxin-antitoxin module
MPSNTSKVQKKANGQYVVTIPKALAEALDLAGATVAWQTVSGTKLSMDKQDQ